MCWSGWWFGLLAESFRTVTCLLHKITADSHMSILHVNTHDNILIEREGWSAETWGRDRGPVGNMVGFCV